MMKARQLKELIAEGLREIFESEGFKYFNAANEFKRKEKNKTFIYNILQTTWSDRHSIDVRLFLSQHQIENILCKILGKQRHSYTMGGDIGRIYNSPDGRQVINGNLSIWLQHEEEIPSAVESLICYYHDIAAPYFRRYDNLNAIDDIMNNGPFDYCPAHVAGIFAERCMKGLIVARLVANPSYNTLVDKYNEVIKQTMDPESIENYQTVRDYLNYNSIID